MTRRRAAPAPVADPGGTPAAGRALRVLFVGDALDAHGGAERSQLELAEALVERGHRVRVLYSRAGRFSDRWQALSESMHQVPVTQGDGSRRTDLQLLAGAVAARRAAAGCDVVHANSVRLAFLASLAARSHGLPLVCHLRLPDPPGRSVKTVVGRAAVTRYVAVSADTRDRHVAAGLPAERIEVVHNGIDPARYPLQDAQARARSRAALGVSQDAFVALYAGRLDPDKGLDVLLEAWRPASPDDVLLVAGAPAQHREPAWAAAYEAGLRSAAGRQVRFLGPALDVVPLYAAADVVVLPSLFPEPFGRVVLEAMACGRPVLATAVGGVPEVLAGFPELLVPPGDPAALAACLAAGRAAAADPDLPERLRAHVERSFSLSATAGGVERVLAEAVALRPGRARRRT